LLLVFCYSINLECSPKAIVLKDWSAVETFKSWGLVGSLRSLGHDLKADCVTPVSFSASLLHSEHEVSSFTPLNTSFTLFHLQQWSQWSFIEAFKIVKNNPFLFYSWLSQVFVLGAESWLKHLRFLHFFNNANWICYCCFYI
jgi:hypothetical protein